MSPAATRPVTFLRRLGRCGGHPAGTGATSTNNSRRAARSHAHLPSMPHHAMCAGILPECYLSPADKTCASLFSRPAPGADRRPAWPRLATMRVVHWIHRRATHNWAPPTVSHQTSLAGTLLVMKPRANTAQVSHTAVAKQAFFPARQRHHGARRTLMADLCKAAC